MVPQTPMDGNTKTEVQITVNKSRHQRLETHWLEKSNITHVPFKVIGQTQKDWRAVLSALNVGNIDSWNVFGFIQSQCLGKASIEF